MHVAAASPNKKQPQRRSAQRLFAKMCPEPREQSEMSRHIHSAPDRFADQHRCDFACSLHRIILSHHGRGPAAAEKFNAFNPRAIYAALHK